MSMQTETFIQGMSLGLAYAAPIGIQNMFVMNMAIKAHRSRAIACGLAVAFFDASLALACFYGIGSFISAVPAVRTAAIWIGGTPPCLSAWDSKYYSQSQDKWRGKLPREP